MRPQLSFQVTTANASAKGGEMTRLVEAIETVQTLEINRENRFLIGQNRLWIDVTNHTGPSTIGNEMSTNFACIGYEIAYLTFTFRIGYPIGKTANAATAQCNPVRQALPTGVVNPFHRVSRNKIVRRQSRRRNLC